MADAATLHRDFFISRTDADKAIALVIAKILRAAGFTTWLQDEDFGSASFMERMAHGWSGSERLICLLSQAYQRSDYCRKESRPRPLPHRGRRRLVSNPEGLTPPRPAPRKVTFLNWMFGRL